jgi:hypothetical protein
LEESTLIKITAILMLGLIEVVNLLTFKYDGAILVTIASIIAGIAGYQIGLTKGVSRRRDRDAR